MADSNKPPLRAIPGGRVTVHEPGEELLKDRIKVILIPSGEEGMILLEAKSFAQVWLGKPISFTIPNHALAAIHEHGDD